MIQQQQRIWAAGERHYSVLFALVVIVVVFASLVVATAVSIDLIG
jgi:hypothetical protein